MGGSYIPFHVNPLVLIPIPFVFLALFVFVPETPQYLLKIRRNADAEKSLRFYRNCPPSSSYNASLLSELQILNAIAIQNEQQPPVKLADFLTPAALRAMSISPFMMAINQLSGAFAISNYAETIFNETGSTFDPQISAIIIAIVQLIGCYVAALLMDKVGRKDLLIISSMGSMIALFLTGTFAFVAAKGVDVSAFNWMPLTFISSFLFIGSIGLLPVPYVILAEVIPSNIRRVASSVCTCVVFVSSAIMLRLMPKLLEELHLYGSMWLFAIVCLVGLIFTVTMVQETRGINLNVLETPTSEMKPLKGIQHTVA